MKFQKIEVDEEVFEYLKRKAEPFVDTPNSVLRRELLSKKNKAKESPVIAGRFPDLPRGIPTALQHTLEVIFLVKEKGMSRPEATNVVANRHSIAPQTVLDKYCRQLDKKAYEIDMLLDDSNINNFKLLLRRRFTDHSNVINDFFEKISRNKN